MTTTQRTPPTLADALREAIRTSGQSIHAVSLGARINYASLHGFMHNSRSLSLNNATKVAQYLGLELRPVKRGGGR